MRPPRDFHALGRGEGPALVFLIAFAALSFLPPWRAIEIAGVSAFGWLMAALMVLSPLLTLALFYRASRRRR